ncbi:anti-sigma regulatory factor [Leisingera sp. ANG-Vp]|uniref:anti-sigma regulatory factor n=1 Tax=Leisingera sp. ANG-Vp TaxID=1577896 RepID=UPI00057F1F70|nr:anti-sigma regulatory factor [Leisingera sp. ANG-Vp]KIC19930.1 serine/threonine protein kinase [Leisingera sp. ANG-Vp]
MKAAETVTAQQQSVQHDGDVVLARQMGRQMAMALGFSKPDQALIATAISELARNIVNYASHGTVDAQPVSDGRDTGLHVVVSDRGPGIDDIEAAMTDGFSTGRSLGLGLPGTKRIVDEFDIQSTPGKGVTVTIIKWKHR